MKLDKDYVVVKLVSGETVMAMFEGEDDKFIKIDYPVQIKTIPLPIANREHITASPLCQFSDSTTFVLEKSHVIYIKRMHRAFVPHYCNFIKAYDEALIPASREATQEVRRQLEDLFEDEEGELTIEEVNKRLEMLEAIAGASTPEEEEDTINPANFISGNDTKH